MESLLPRHLRVERRGEDAPLSHRHDATVLERRQTLHVWADPLDDGRADEHRMHRRIAEHRHVEIRLEGLGLGAEGVAADRRVQTSERLLAFDAVDDPVGEKDQAGAGPVYGHPAGYGLPDRLTQAECAGQLVDDARLPAGEDEAVHGGELGWATHEGHLGTEAGEHASMLTHVALERQDADARKGGGHVRAVYQPRSARR